MKLVYIAHPLRGSFGANIAAAKRYYAAALDAGLGPVAPYLVEGVLDEDVPGDREQGLELDKALLAKCDEVWLCGETMSNGMRLEADEALRLNIPCVSALIGKGDGALYLTALAPDLVAAIEVGQW